MHFAEDHNTTPLFIREYKDGHIRTNAWEFNSPIVLFNNKALDNTLPHTLKELTEIHLQTLAELKPELVIIGTGKTQYFLPPNILAPLYKNRIGVEIMNTDAACRTFNLLLSEGRSVLAALFV